METILFTSQSVFVVAAREVAYLRYYNTKDLGSPKNVTVNGADKAFDTHSSFNILNLALSDDGVLLAAATDKDRIIVFQTNTPHIVCNLYGHKASPFSNPRVTFNAAGNCVVATSEDNKLFTWDLRDGKIVSVIDDVHKGTIRDMAGGAGGTIVTASFDKSVKIWVKA